MAPIRVSPSTAHAAARLSRWLVLVGPAWLVLVHEQPWAVAGLAGLALALAALLLGRAAGAAAAESAPMPTLPAQVPGCGTKCFHGIRVVELATVVAAPSAARTLAEHGAEVIKIEEPKGDMWRKFFLEYEDERGTEPGFSSCFESVNLSKYSVAIDLKSPAGVAKLKKILSEADVFITNVRPSGLKRLGLDFPSLRTEFPSLIVAQLTAWGLDGPGSNLAGYDIGAFWTATGMSALLHSEGHYSVYPIAAGDCITGAGLLAGINMALCHRAKTGEGQHVTNSLLHTGLYCVSHTLSTTAPVDTPVYAQAEDARRRPCSTSYRTRDGKRVVILGSGAEATTLNALAGGFPRLAKLKHLVPKAEGESADKSQDTALLAALQDCFEQFTLKKLLIKLEQLDVPHCEQPSVPEMTAPAGDCRNRFCGDGPGGSRCYTSGPAIGIHDIPRLARNPLHLSCSPETEHGAEPLCRAPALGAHTASFDRQGW
jgi:crotonobetainyl-CoA:carnitine CoA-transferase CaiB-like acyl-CoA transferase